MVLCFGQVTEVRQVLGDVDVRWWLRNCRHRRNCRIYRKQEDRLVPRKVERWTVVMRSRFGC